MLAQKGVGAGKQWIKGTAALTGLFGGRWECQAQVWVVFCVQPPLVLLSAPSHTVQTHSCVTKGPRNTMWRVYFTLIRFKGVSNTQATWNTHTTKGLHLNPNILYYITDKSRRERHFLLYMPGWRTAEWCVRACVWECGVCFHQCVDVSAPRLPSHMWSIPDWSTVTQLSPEQV